MTMPVKKPVIVPDAQVDELVDEALDPTLSRDRVFFGDLEGEHKTFQVRIPNLRASRRVLKVIAPKLVLLQDLASKAADAANYDASKVGFEAIANMGPIVEALADEIPDVLEALFEAQGGKAAWFDEHATLPQVVEAIRAQLAKLGVVEILGKR